MKIFIPMAGKGTRLRPFTLTCPKPLINILDKPIVEHLIDQITSKVKVKIDEIIYILGDKTYFNSEVVNSLRIISEKYNAKTKIYRQLEQLGTGHAIMCAEESLSGPSIIAYADTMIKGNIEIDSQVDGIMWVKKVDNPSAYGVVNLDDKNKITELIEKPVEFISDLAVVGIYYFKESANLRRYLKKHLLEKLSPGNEYLLNYGIEQMIKNGDTFIPKEIDIWMDCGTPELLLNSAKVIMDNYHNNFEPNEIYDKEVIIKPPVYIGKNVTIQNSNIGPYVSIGDNCHIENTTVNNSIVFKSVKINNSNIDNSIIGSNSIYEGSDSNLYLGDNSKLINNDI
tara:strand:- start:4637 stop:5656 length:1020 start_codon:yes stop_codon:yes gene_type:complete